MSGQQGEDSKIIFRLIRENKSLVGNSDILMQFIAIKYHFQGRHHATYFVILRRITFCSFKAFFAFENIWCLKMMHLLQFCTCGFYVVSK